MVRGCDRIVPVDIYVPGREGGASPERDGSAVGLCAWAVLGAVLKDLSAPLKLRMLRSDLPRGVQQARGVLVMSLASNSYVKCGLQRHRPRTPVRHHLA